MFEKNDTCRVLNGHILLRKHIEGSQPEWCISSMIYSGDAPFWSETLDFVCLFAVCPMIYLSAVCILICFSFMFVLGTSSSSSAFDVMTVLNPQAVDC